mmetsp:Transcript_15582/g.30190  ORF Transcript_15582/g.30190 Transcript_15582/m.30190 type:complete len:199 (-) Transcript_15582:307-903(-)
MEVTVVVSDVVKVAVFVFVWEVAVNVVDVSVVVKVIDVAVIVKETVVVVSVVVSVLVDVLGAAVLLLLLTLLPSSLLPSSVCKDVGNERSAQLSTKGHERRCRSLSAPFHGVSQHARVLAWDPLLRHAPSLGFETASHRSPRHRQFPAARQASAHTCAADCRTPLLAPPLTKVDFSALQSYHQHLCEAVLMDAPKRFP